MVGDVKRSLNMVSIFDNNAMRPAIRWLNIHGKYEAFDRNKEITHWQFCIGSLTSPYITRTGAICTSHALSINLNVLNDWRDYNGIR